MRVHGVGPVPCPWMLVGEGPGKTESETGIPFHPEAPAGAELTRYLNGASLPFRDQVYITNLVKEWVSGGKTKKQEVTPDDVAASEWELMTEIETVQPDLVITLGRWSTQWFLGPGWDMDACHGLLFLVRYCVACGRRGAKGIPSCPCGNPTGLRLLYVLPVYHPAAGLHQPELAARTAYDLAQWSALRTVPRHQWPSRCWKPSPPGTYLRGVSVTFMSKFHGDVGVDTEYDAKSQDPWGLSISGKPGTASVIQKGGFVSIAPEATIRWIFHFYGADVGPLAKLGLDVDEDQFDDTGVMAYLLGVEPQALKDLALRHLGRNRKTFQETFGEYVEVLGKSGKPLKKKKFFLKGFDDVEPQVMTDYAGGDADDTLSLKPILWKKVQDLGLEGVYEIDRKVLPLYARMEATGLPVNLEYYHQFSEDLECDLLLKTLDIQQEFPGFNPESPDQVAAILFDHLHLPGGKKTPTGKRFTTDDKALEAIKTLHPLVAQIQDIRELAKIKNTFVDTLPKFTRPAPDGGGDRLYYQLLPTRVVSGRLAAKDPNVLALPKHSPLGKRFRGGVQAPPGRLLGSWDFSQIELRVLALDSGSSTLLTAFQQKVDLHARTGHRIFEVKPEDQDESLHRLPSKTTNFSIIMGTTGVGLAEQMRKNGYPFPELTGQTFKSHKARWKAQEEVCAGWIAEVIQDWGIDGFIKECHAEARRQGFVRERWGRIRFLPSVLSPNRQIRENALRQAQAFKPQAGARGYVKTFQARLWREVIKPLRAEGYYIEPILDIHDDTLLEFDEELGPLLLPVVTSLATSCFEEVIPMEVEGKVGKVWSQLKKAKELGY